MKNNYLLLLSLLVNYNIYSQLHRSDGAAMAAPIGPGDENVYFNGIGFDYDVSGNQIKRYLILLPYFKTSNPGNFTEQSPDIVTSDLIKADIYDDIKYYPNPVKQELYVQWINNTENYVSQIELYSISGQLLKRYDSMKATTNATIDFGNYPQGFYTVQLVYARGENKTLKIVKQ
ncbi:MAG: T9SS type A sorting domain-containing protein [Flavobacterium sp. JAD_PAG50586_2]|nr:MAG: T9SS type A sorting domain-containing protein [Flavobacterium sp. JAD_PAG50586_2]